MHREGGLFRQRVSEYHRETIAIFPGGYTMCKQFQNGSLVLTLVLGTALMAAASESLPTIADYPSYDPEMLFKCQLSEARRCYEERKELLSSLRTEEAWRERLDFVRSRIADMIGEFPERTPLNARVVGRLDRGDYVIEKVIYESRPRFYVTANLYVPKGAEFPVPGILFPCGHSATGKAADVYQMGCIGLAKKGYVVLNYDPIGQGERLQIVDRKTNESRVGVGTTEHYYLGNPCYLLGTNLAMYRTWDGIRGIDYLESRPEVDSSKIGCVGNSGGGTLTTYISAADRRVKVAVPSCYITTLFHRIRSRITADAEQNFIGCYRDLIDHADMLMIRYPHYTQINCAIRDYFPIEGARDAYDDLRAMYSFFGEEDRVNRVESNEEHGFTLPLREGAYAWFNRCFRGASGLAQEPQLQIETAETLQVTETGQVVTSLGGETVFSLNQGLYNQIKPHFRAEDWDDRRRAVQDNVRELLAVGEVPAARLVFQRTATWGKYRLTYSVVESEPDIVVPCDIYEPNAESPAADAKLVIYIDENGKGVLREDEARLGEIGGDGIVVATDPRGIGETMSRHGDRRRYYDYHAVETEFTYNSFILGRPLIGRRVFDVLSVLQWVRRQPQWTGRRIQLRGRGRGALIVLFAAALEGSIDEVVCEDMLLSYEEIVTHEVYGHHPCSFVPGILKVCDLPQIAAMVCPRPLRFVRLRDAMNEALSVEEAARPYAFTGAVYAAAGQASAFSVE
jgi:cephalosporin-C deacetylase-like acetyl esterase